MADNMMADDLFDVFESGSSATIASVGLKRKQNDIETYDDDGNEQDVITKIIKGDNEDEQTVVDTRELDGKEKEDIAPEELLPRIQIHRVEAVEACTHEVAIPHEMEYTPLRAPTTKPPKEYPFILDPFQKEAVLCLENEQSVLVSAHTSAGKTVVAEYAVAMSLRDKQRVIYTTPIKALSNQKYRELYEEFQDVGLMTGDITINPTASCLVMTTEILRSMLYRGSEVMREVGWVIFDEIHYMRDKERGVVWEETIILLPDSVHFVFLSATIPNARQFAEWICHLHNQPCHVVYTDYRPTPLQHYVFPAGGDGLHLVVDEKSEFREENFNAAMAVLTSAGDAAKGDKPGRKGGARGESNCFKIVKMIMERNFQPVIVFSFSKKECEAYAIQMAKIDFNTEEEKTLVGEVFSNAMDALSEEDRKLPQVEAVLPLLKKGIGIHHGGLLPILKETIEILFGEGLIKALFATETFAMGLNMPARTVLFTNARKFDGKDFRWITSGEYIQMSGRAGRRGIDDRGIVILMVDEKMSPTVGKELVKGSADALNSAFHLTYNMVLNLLRVEEINPEYMLERSFHQFQNYAALPRLHESLRRQEEQQAALAIPREAEVESYYKIRQQLDSLGREFRAYLTRPLYLVPFLQPGRLVRVKSGDDDFGWSVVVAFQKKSGGKSDVVGASESTYVIDALLHVASDGAASRDPRRIKPYAAGERGEMVVVPVLMSAVQAVSSVRLYCPRDLRPPDNRGSVLRALQEVQRRFAQGLPLLDPVDDMGIKEKPFVDVVRKIEAFERRLHAHALAGDEALASLYERYDEKARLAAGVRTARAELKRARSLVQMDELKCRKRVLRRMGYCTASDVIELKGRVACEISSGDELLLTELMFNGVFNELTAPQCVALLSTFVFDEKSAQMPKLTDELSGPLRLMQDLARRIAKVSNEAKLPVEEDEYVEKFKPTMMDVTYAWARGATFAQICKMTDVFEGSVIRCMRRLEELLREMSCAAKAIGNTDLENKFAEGIKSIKRDIIFAASLYL